MAIAYDEASENYFFALEVINFVFTGIFIIECILKLVGLGPK